MPTDRKPMVFPIGIISRDLDGKLLLALCAQERGWRTIIGGSNAIKDWLRRSEPCLYFAKSARAAKGRLFARLKELGHEVVVLDEESLVRQSDDIFVMKHEKNALKNVDLMLTWGEDSRKMWLHSGWMDGLPTEAVGNPRVDMLMPQLQGYHQENIDAILSRYGEFVLFNSNFGTVSNRLTRGVLFNLAKWADGDEAERATAEFLAHKAAVFDRFRLLVSKLAAEIAPRNLIIRPHPSENHAPWKEAAAGCANVHVIFEGSVVPWLMAARVLIHNGCTSAVEAAIGGTPVLTYRPVISNRFDNPLPNGVGVECFTEEELLSGVEKVLAGSRCVLRADQNALLHHNITFEQGGLCSDAIVEAIERTTVGAAERRVPLHKWLGIRRQRHLLRNRSKNCSSMGRAAEKPHEFSGLTQDMVTSRIGKFNKSLSRFHGVNVREIEKNLIELS